MSDNQRRAFCRFLFMLACVLPTSVVGYWICHPQTPAGWERAIQAQLGVTTKIDSVETPGPYVTILRGLEFTDPDGERIFYTVTTRIEFGGPFNQIVFPDRVHSLTNKGLSYLIDHVNENVVRRRSSDKPWSVVFLENANIRNAFVSPAIENSDDRIALTKVVDSGLTISEIELFVEPTMPQADGMRAVAKFNVVDAGGHAISDEPVFCEVSRTDQGGHVMRLNTSKSAVPCWLVDTALNLQGKIGSNATFNGVATLFEPQSATAIVEVRGVFDHVDLSRSVATFASPTNARIALNKCEFKNGEFLAWDALLYQDPDLPPKRIDQKHLFHSTRNFDIAGTWKKRGWM